jgi:cytochrome P450 monooxygenase
MLSQLFQVVQFLREEAGLIWTCVALVLFVYLLLPKPTYSTNVKVPTVKFGSPWIPEILNRILFNTYAPSVIYDGYSKVRSNPGHHGVRV